MVHVRLRCADLHRVGGRYWCRLVAGNALQYLRSFGLGAALDALDLVIYAIYIGLVMSSFTSRRAVVAGLAGGALALVL